MAQITGARAPRATIVNEPMHAIDYVIYTLWAVFWLGWLIAGATAERTAQSRMGQFVGLRVAMLVVAYVAIRFGFLKGHRTIVSSPVLQGFGMALFLLGLGLAVWARVHLGGTGERRCPRRWIPSSSLPVRTGASGIPSTRGSSSPMSERRSRSAVLANRGRIAAAYFTYSATVEERFMAGLFPSPIRSTGARPRC